MIRHLTDEDISFRKLKQLADTVAEWFRTASWWFGHRHVLFYAVNHSRRPTECLKT
jgi:hypothetical protein